MRIMLVDDEPGITSTLKLGLEHHGYQVDAFNDPKRALAEFEADRYIMIFLDIRMPQMNGFDLYRALRKKDHEVPIAFMSAFDVYQKEFRKAFPEMKVDRFIRKPIGLDQLVAYVKSQESPTENPLVDGKQELYR
jgi:DNA-binding response OmpR family regulator